VTSVDVCDMRNLFASASADGTVRFWDYRIKMGCIKTCTYYESDVKMVKFMWDGRGIVSCSDDMTCQFVDLRSFTMINRYSNDKIKKDLNAVAVSKTGKFIFAACSDGFTYCFDTLSTLNLRTLGEHDDQVTTVAVSPNGATLLTSSSDWTVKVWGSA